MWKIIQNLGILRNVLFALLLKFTLCKCTDIDYDNLELNKQYHNEVTLNTVLNYRYMVTKESENFLVETTVDPNDLNNALIYPVAFQIRHQNNLQGWRIPFQLGLPIYSAVNKTICLNAHNPPPDNYETTTTPITTTTTRLTIPRTQNSVTITISTFSKSKIKFSLRVRNVCNLLKMNESREVFVSPATAPLFHFHFPPGQKAVKIHVDSDDSSCMTLSVQQPKCPFCDTENSTRHTGYWLTMTTNGAMVVPKERFPKGFFLVLVVHDTDDECKTQYGKRFHNKSLKSVTPKYYSYLNYNKNVLPPRTKLVTVNILDTVSKNRVILALIWPFGLLLLLAALTCVVLHYINYTETKMSKQESEKTGRNTERVPCLYSGTTEEESEMPLVPQQDMETQQVENYSSPKGSKNWIKNIFSPPLLSKFVMLNQLYTETTAKLDQNSTMFLLFVIPIAIYYCLPAIQLVFFYLLTSNKTGNLDLCYYNFRCAYPYWYFNDFNHVWSNICYIFVGIFGLMLVHYHKQKYINKLSYKVGYGIPPQFGLSNALAFAILIEGLLSASYHVCPNRSNFHHDTCFMYVAVTLSALRLYHSRHPDIALGATKAFALLGIVIITDLLGEPLEYLWYLLLFSLLHFVTLANLATELFFLGRRSHFYSSILRALWAVIMNDRSGHSDTYPVASRDVYWLIIVGFLANVGIFLGLGLIPFSDETKPVFDLGTYLLTILGGNAVLYLFYYLFMKWILGEGLSKLTWILLIITASFWISGTICFGMTKSSWEESPANSRVKNKDCDSYFYDTHDL